MADNMIYSDIPSLRRAVVVGNDVAPGTPVVTGQGAGVTLTGSGDYQRTAEVTLPDGTTATYVDRLRGGVGLEDDEATVTFTGSFAFVFEGSDEAEAGDVVTIEAGGELAVAGAGDRLGVVEFVRPEDGAAVVKIGV